MFQNRIAVKFADASLHEGFGIKGTFNVNPLFQLSCKMDDHQDFHLKCKDDGTNANNCFHDHGFLPHSRRGRRRCRKDADSLKHQSTTNHNSTRSGDDLSFINDDFTNHNAFNSTSEEDMRDDCNEFNGHLSRYKRCHRYSKKAWYRS